MTESAMGTRLNLLDLAFLALETQRTPVNVASLQVFDLPDDADEHYFRNLLAQMRAHKPGRPFNLKLSSPSPTSFPQWVVDRDLDIEYHVRHSALPRPGSQQDLLELVSRLHSRLMDRERPLWEFHIIEGMADRQFAIYTKMHHAAIDGMGGIALLEACLNVSADQPVQAPWAGLCGAVKGSRPVNWPNPLRLLKMVRDQIDVGGDFLRLVMGQGLKLAGLRPDYSPPPFTAPETPFNVPISAARKFAIQTLPLSGIKALARQSGATVNDIVLAICSGALRDHLKARGALPKKSLVATVPMSIRQINRSGNQITYVSAQLGTQRRNPLTRLSEISRSTRHAKQEIAGVEPGAAVGFAVLAQGIVAILNRLHASSLLPPPANVVISNVPGPRRPLYFGAARMRATYPLSVLVDGQALNITVMSYEDSVDFGLMACREAVPDVQSLTDAIVVSYRELEAAIARMAPQGEKSTAKTTRRRRSATAGKSARSNGAKAGRKKASQKKSSAKAAAGKPSKATRKAGKKRAASSAGSPPRTVASGKKTTNGAASGKKRRSKARAPKAVSSSGKPLRSLRQKQSR